MQVLTPADVSAGLPASAAASALLGQSGAAALLILLFLAVTSATSAELIAVSSVLTYDVYKVSINVDSYIHPVTYDTPSEVHQSSRERGADSQDGSLHGMFEFYHLNGTLTIYVQVAFFGIVMGVAGTIFFYIGVSMGWLYVSPSRLSFSLPGVLTRSFVLDLHGRHPWICRGPHCAVHYVEESKQVGLHRWCRRRLLCGCHCVACYHQLSE